MADPRDPDEIEDEDLREGDEGSDAGQIDDESGNDAQAGQESQDDEVQERVDRRSRRDEVLREELRAEREHRARVEAELNIIRQEREQRQQPQSQGETDEQFNARVALLDPETRMDAKLARATQQHRQLSALQSYALADNNDKIAFETKAMFDPMRKKLAARVEELRKIEYAQGRTFPRETLYKFALGEEKERELLRQQKRPGATQNQRPTQRAPAAGRNDAPREQRQRRYAPNDSSAEAVRARLEAPDAYI